MKRSAYPGILVLLFPCDIGHFHCPSICQANEMKLLIVEDRFPLRQSISMRLRESGYAVDVAGDGASALWFAMGNEYDVILLDLMLPVLDGLRVLNKFRLAGGTSQVLILSAKGAIPDRVRGLGAGADDYLVKPFAFEELWARVSALIRRKYNRKDPVIRIEHLRIETTSQRVWRGGKEIRLPPRQYAVLEYLVMRQGDTVCQTDVWEHIFDSHDASTVNVVDVHISYLRKKIDLPGRPSLIRTVPGRGYALGMKR